MARLRLRHRRLVRLGAVGAVAALALALSGCTGGLPTTVTSVTGTLEPYLPTLGDQGIPAEQVNFTVDDYSYGSADLVCLIGVRYDGNLVGSTLVTIGSEVGTPSQGGVGEVDESVAVEVDLPSPFDGTPSDASVGCATGG